MVAAVGFWSSLAAAVAPRLCSSRFVFGSRSTFVASSSELLVSKSKRFFSCRPVDAAPPAADELFPLPLVDDDFDVAFDDRSPRRVAAEGRFRAAGDG